MRTQSPINYGVSAGTNGTYTATIDTIGANPSNGLMLTLKMHQASTAHDATLAVNGGTAYPLIKQTDGSQITDTGIWAIDTFLLIVYSSTGVSSSTPAWVVIGV